MNNGDIKEAGCAVYAMPAAYRQCLCISNRTDPVD